MKKRKNDLENGVDTRTDIFTRKKIQEVTGQV